MRFIPPNFQKSNIIIIFDQMIVSGCNFILGILLARFLGLDLYGLYSLLWLIVLFISSIQLAFVITPLLNFGAKKKAYALEVFLSNMFYFQIILTFALALILWGFFKIAPFFSSEWQIDPPVYYSLIGVTFVFLLQDFLRRYYILKSKFLLLILLDAIAYIGQICILIGLFLFDQVSLVNVLFTLLLTLSISVIIGFLKFEFHPFKKKYGIFLLYKNWAYSKWLVYSAILQWGSGNYFILAAGSVLGVWAVGVIKIIQNLMGVFHVLFLAFENILPISFSRIYHKDGLQTLLKYSKKYILYGIGAFFFLILLAIPTSSKLVSILYGFDNSKYSYLLIWFLIIYFFIYSGMIIRFILRTIDNTKIIFYGYVVNLIFSLSFSSILINTFGIAGVAVGMLIIQIIMNLMMYLFIENKGKIISLSWK